MYVQLHMLHIFTYLYYISLHIFTYSISVCFPAPYCSLDPIPRKACGSLATSCGIAAGRGSSTCMAADRCGPKARPVSRRYGSQWPIDIHGL